MEQYEFEIAVTAESEEKASEKLGALMKLADMLPHEDLIGVINLIENNPAIMPMIQSIFTNPPKDVLGWMSAYNKLKDSLKPA